MKTSLQPACSSASGFGCRDGVGYGDYACLGNPIMRTPVVGAFKKRSLLFTQFHVSPTRVALMSERHGVQERRHPHDPPSNANG